MIKLCEQNGVTVIYETIPFNESSKTKFDPEVIRKHGEFTRSLTQKYPNHEFSDKVFFIKDAYFEDGHHMNELGTEFYTNYLLNNYFPRKRKSTSTKDEGNGFATE